MLFFSHGHSQQTKRKETMLGYWMFYFNGLIIRMFMRVGDLFFGNRSLSIEIIRWHWEIVWVMGMSKDIFENSKDYVNNFLVNSIAVFLYVEKTFSTANLWQTNEGQWLENFLRSRLNRMSRCENKTKQNDLLLIIQPSNQFYISFYDGIHSIWWYYSIQTSDKNQNDRFSDLHPSRKIIEQLNNDEWKWSVFCTCDERNDDCKMWWMIS